MGDVLGVNFSTVKGSSIYSPNVPVTAWGTYKGESDLFYMRVDTGSDITCIPKDMVADIDFEHTQPLRIRDHAGSIHRVPVYMATISIHNNDNVWHFRPDRGVLITKSPIGLLGMDILRDLSMTMKNETLILERKRND